MKYNKSISTCLLGVVLAAAVLVSTGGCAPKVEIRGSVTDMKDGAPIAGAQVQAVDTEGADVGNAATTDEEGLYVLSVPETMKTDDGDVPAVYTLRASAEGYATFPSPTRPAPLLDMALAVKANQTKATRVFENELTAITLTRQVIIRGHVLDLADDTPIAGALVQAVDINGTPVGDTAETDAEGDYELGVPQIWDLDGVHNAGDPVAYGTFMLRCQAMGYQEFPSAIRPSLPIDMTMAVEVPPTGQQTIGTLLIDETTTTLTTIKLIALPGDVSLLGSISGTILSTRPAGVLVIAVNDATQKAYTGFSGFDGRYIVFNVVEGTYHVEGYTAGVQFVPVPSVAVGVGEQRSGVDLSESTNPLSTVSGNVQIVNGNGFSITSVVLAVESTFDPVAIRGAVPPGLRVGDVTGAFTIENVPDGRYVVLAAFENDGLVRDPDLAIAGTQIVHLQVPGPNGENIITIPDSFKITGALTIFGPGADSPEAVTTPTPTFRWADDSSEEGYEIRVLDSFGNLMWENKNLPGVSGGDVSVVYAGSALEDGMYYQFRVQSFRIRQGAHSPISSTEDLKGVFYYEAAR